MASRHTKEWSVMINPIESMRFGRRDQGFTLVELMVVIGLLVTFGLLTSSFDTASWMANYRLRGAARELYLEMQKTRMEAIKEDTSRAIFFDSANNLYRVYSDPGPDGVLSTVADNVVARTITLAQYGNGVSYGRGSSTSDAPDDSVAPGDSVTFAGDLVIFTPSGMASGLGYCYLTNDQNGAYAVGTLTSGVIRLRKWNGNAWQ
jgi:prepilin-type N-terminal cleavage/methylation domain-containing protein